MMEERQEGLSLSSQQFSFEPLALMEPALKK